jgi:hypothetical protein
MRGIEKHSVAGVGSTDPWRLLDNRGGAVLPGEAMHRISWGAVWLALLTGCNASSDGAARDSSPRDAAGDGAARDSSARSTDSGAGEATDAKSDTADSCSPRLPDGGYTIETDEDVAAIAGCTEITGALSVTGDTLTTLSLPKLKTISGSLVINKTGVLASFSLPSLEQIDGYLTIDENAALTMFRLGALKNIRDSFAIDYNDALTDFDLSALSNTNFMTVAYNGAIVIFNLPALEVVGTFAFNQNASLTTISFPKLTSISGDGFMIGNNNALTTLSLPLLTTLIGDITVINNPKFPSCQMKAIAAQFTDQSVPISTIGNDDLATCP